YQSLVRNFDLQENLFQYTSHFYKFLKARHESTISHRCQNTYAGYRAERAETLEQTFTRLSDLDTMSLDDLYNHLKKKTEKKISIQGSDVVGFDKSKVECFNCHKMGHFARECRAPKNQERGMRDTYRQESKAKEQTPKALMAIDRELETIKQEKEVVDGKLAGLLSASKDLDNLIESQRPDKSKEGLGYTVVPPLVAQLYLSPKKDLSWTGLLECVDDTVTDNSRPSPTIASSLEEDQNRNPSASENVASPITPKQFVKFIKASDS
nr:ribonuclease H-like domain-containing protein [Tanacetum cinerariifolium]